MKAYGGVEVWIYILLTSAIVGGERSASTLLPHTPPQKRLRYPLYRRVGGGGSRAGLDNVEKRKFLTLAGFEFQPPVVQPAASRYSDDAIPAPKGHTTTVFILGVGQERILGAATSMYPPVRVWQISRPTNHYLNNTTLVDLKGFWRWCMLYRAIGLVFDSIHRIVCGRQKTTTIRRLGLSPSSGGWGRINLLSWAR
jgi:hypothetical protein